MPRLRRIPLKRKQTAQADPLLEVLGDATGGERVIRFLRLLKHSKGEWAGQPFEPLPFQQEIIHAIFDPLTEAGVRRIRNGLVFIPRKCGKTTLAAGLGAYMLFCDEPGGQVVCAANSRDQASLLFNEAANLIESSEVLKERAVVSRATKRITDKVTRSTFRAISADAPTAHGLDLTCWIYDELHGAPNRELYDTLATATGARRQPLGLVISTAGFDKLSILGEVYEHAKRVAADPSLDPSFYSFIAEASDTDAWDDPATWRKANPALGVFRNAEEIALAAQAAKASPGKVESFRRLYLNIWTAAEQAWLDMAAWDACSGDVPDFDLEGAECYAGLDLSATTDLTAFVMVFPRDDGRLCIRHRAWLPAEGILDRERRDRVPYRRWADEGRIEFTPGAVIDQKFIIDRVKQWAERYDIRRVNFDRWGSALVVSELQDAGIAVVQMGQGYSSMSAATKELEAAVLSQRLAHGGCPLLRWQASGATIASDPAGNCKIVKPDRMRHTRRVDSLVALAMALDGVLRCHSSAAIDRFLEDPVVF